MNQLEKSISQSWELWLSVHHFLPTKWLLFLLDRIFRESTQGAHGFADVFTVTTCSDDFANASIFPKVNFPDHLHQLYIFALAILWRNDHGASYVRAEAGIDMLRQVRAYQLGISGAGALESSENDYGSVDGLAKAVIRLDTPEKVTWNEVSSDLAEHDPILRAILFKHLGDLLGDKGAWKQCEEGYAAARQLLIGIEDRSGWDDTHSSWIWVVELSIGMCVRRLRSNEETQTYYENLFLSNRERVTANALLFINGWRSASAGSPRIKREILELQGSMVLESNLFDSSVDLAPALVASKAKNWKETMRWFTAYVRRARAWGLEQETRNGLSRFGRSLLEIGIAENQAHLMRPIIEAMIESEDYEGTATTSWPSWFINESLTTELVDWALMNSVVHVGAKRRRLRVFLALCDNWFAALPHTSSTEILLLHIWGKAIDLAEEYPVSVMAVEDVGGAALKALEQWAMKAYDLRDRVANKIALVTQKKLTQAQLFWREAYDAISSFYPYADVCSPDPLRDTLQVCTKVLKESKGDPHVSGALLQLLTLDASIAVMREEDIADFAKTLDEVAEVNLQDPSLLAIWAVLLKADKETAAPRFNAIASRRLSVTAEVSTQTDAILRQLAQCADFLSNENVLAFIDRVRIMLDTAKDATQPRFLFANIPQYLDALFRTKAPARRDLQAAINELLRLILEVWDLLPSKEWLLSRYTFGASNPNIDSDVVFLWTTVTYRMAVKLNREDALVTLWEKVSQIPKAKPAFLKAVLTERTTSQQASAILDKDIWKAVNDLPPDHFYGETLSCLLAILPDLEAGGLEIMKALVERALALGPNIQDAGVFLLALSRTDVTVELSQLTDYEAKLRGANRDVAHVIRPIFFRFAAPMIPPEA